MPILWEEAKLGSGLQTHSQGARETPSSPPPQRSPALLPLPSNSPAILGPACAASLPRCIESREQGADQRLYPRHPSSSCPTAGSTRPQTTRVPTRVHTCTHTCTLTYTRTHRPPEQHVQRRLCPLGVKLPGNRRKAALSLSRETPLREKSGEKTLGAVTSKGKILSAPRCPGSLGLLKGQRSEAPASSPSPPPCPRTLLARLLSGCPGHRTSPRAGRLHALRRNRLPPGGSPSPHAGRLRE